MKTRIFTVLSLAAALLATPCFAQIKVMSYNIRQSGINDGKNAWENRKPATRAMIYDILPDVFGVQEALKDQVEYIAENCPCYKYEGVGRDDGKSKGEHMAIFYNTETMKLTDWGTFWLSETPDEPSIGWDAACKRTATWAVLQEKSSGRKIFFVNTHLDHKGDYARKQGIILLRSKIEELNKGKLPVVLTGDFNMLPDNPNILEISAYMKNARTSAKKADKIGSFSGYGEKGKYVTGKPELGDKKVKYPTPIDYIFYTGYKTCKEFRVIRTKYAGKEYISDHYPVIAILDGYTKK